MAQSLFIACSLRCLQSDAISTVEQTIDNLPDHITDSLLQQCVKMSKVNAFSKLIAVWPRDYISFDNGARQCDLHRHYLFINSDSDFNQDLTIILINQMIQNKTGKAHKFNLELCHLGEIGTKAIMLAAVNQCEESVSALLSKGKHCRSTRLKVEHHSTCASLSPQRTIWCDIVLSALAQTSSDLYDIAMKAMKSQGSIHIIATGLKSSIAPVLLFPLLDTMKVQYFKRLLIPMSNMKGTHLQKLCSYLQRFSNLEILDISYNNLTEEQSNEIQHLANSLMQLKKLKELRLTGNYLCSSVDIIIESLCPSIKQLYLAGCGVKKQQLKLLRKINATDELTHLDLSSNQLSGNINSVVKLLAKLRKPLKTLIMKDNHFIRTDILLLDSELSGYSNLIYYL